MGRKGTSTLIVPWVSVLVETVYGGRCAPKRCPMHLVADGIWSTMAVVVFFQAVCCIHKNSQLSFCVKEVVSFSLNFFVLMRVAGEHL